MFHPQLKNILLNTLARFDLAEKAYNDPKGNYEDLDVQLHYCEDAIVREFLVRVYDYLDLGTIDIEDVEGDEIYLSLLDEKPPKHIFEKSTKDTESIRLN